jgi:hypothetical protein
VKSILTIRDVKFFLEKDTWRHSSAVVYHLAQMRTRKSAKENMNHLKNQRQYQELSKGFLKVLPF